MTSSDGLHAAVAAAGLASEVENGRLLAATVELARGVYGAQACSVLGFDAEGGELVFEAVAGAGAGELPGRRFPADRGIAGWVLAARQPLVVEDVVQDPRFAVDVAESTGYVPTAIMAAPLLVGERAVGVLEVLDRADDTTLRLADLDVLTHLAEQAGAALDIAARARRARAVLDGGEADVGVVARLAVALDALEGTRRETALTLLATVEELLRPPRDDAAAVMEGF
jgi:GAF domain-containing protein